MSTKYEASDCSATQKNGDFINKSFHVYSSLLRDMRWLCVFHAWERQKMRTKFEPV